MWSINWCSPDLYFQPRLLLYSKSQMPSGHLCICAHFANASFTLLIYVFWKITPYWLYWLPVFFQSKTFLWPLFMVSFLTLKFSLNGIRFIFSIIFCTLEILFKKSFPTPNNIFNYHFIKSLKLLFFIFMFLINLLLCKR